MKNAPPRPLGQAGISAGRPVISGHSHAIAAGHDLAAMAGFRILEAGGNAFDAGVAAGIALGVLQSDIVNVAGVAPIMVYDARQREISTVAGLGHWPRALTPDLFMTRHGGAIPRGLLRTVVPAAPDAWIRTLMRWGTMSFGDVAAAAIHYARDGFAIHPLLAETIATNREHYAEWPSNAAIYLPGGNPPRTGDLFVQSDLARSLQFMADAERAASGKGRIEGLAAARHAFYEGDIARTIVDYHERHGGLLRMEDLAQFESRIERPVATPFGKTTVYTCGFWCQGPVLGQMLRLAEAAGLHRLPHNSADYIHGLTEIIKLAFADRHAYYGDPEFISVPAGHLLSADYAQERAALMRMDRAWPEMPPAGLGASGPDMRAQGAAIKPALDTSYVCVIDKHGNVFSATPSDVSSDTPVIPGTGLCPSSRGSQSWANPAMPAGVAPGKRPRLTPNPAMAMGENGRMIPFGTPGGDVQSQAMLQVFFNLGVFGMNPQEAVEAPRFASYSFPDSFEPHDYLPGRLVLESRLPQELADDLAARGHDIAWWPDWSWKAGAVCLIDKACDGMLSAGADPRRSSYALAW